MKHKDRGPEFLGEQVGHLKSRMGGFVPGSHAVFRGLDLHSQLNGMEWLELYAFGITGRPLSTAQVRMLNALWAYTSYPDARLWNNRVAALAGSARSSGTLGIAAALAVSEATIYGRGVDIRAGDFLRRTRLVVDAGGRLADCVAEEIAAFRGVAGYGRPLTSKDERMAPILALAKDLGLDDGPHLRLAFAVEAYLLAGRWRWRMNYAAVAAALVADMGFSTREYHLMAFPTFLAGMVPCFIEATERPEGATFPLSCADIVYEGPAPRPWPTGAGTDPN